MQKPLIEAPTSDATRKYETLAYVAAYDAVIDCDYAFVAYKETEGEDWRVYVRSSQTAGGVFEPTAIAKEARAAGAQGKPWFVWGYSFATSDSDPRVIEFRVHVADGRPSELEIFVQLRKFDGTADAAKSVKFAWPE